MTRPNPRVRRTHSSTPTRSAPLNRLPSTHARVALAIVAIAFGGCVSGSPETYGVIAYLAGDGVWHDDAARVVAPVIIRRVDPFWPPEYRTSSNQGTVVMKLLVSQEGAVQDVVVIKSVNGVMDKQAVDCARQWGYSPATLHGRPVTVWLKVHVTWKLS